MTDFVTGEISQQTTGPTTGSSEVSTSVISKAETTTQKTVSLSGTRTTLKSESTLSSLKGGEEEVINQEWVIEQLAGMTPDQRTRLGFSFDDLILDCRFAGSQCDST